MLPEILVLTLADSTADVEPLTDALVLKLSLSLAAVLSAALPDSDVDAL